MTIFQCFTYQFGCVRVMVSLTVVVQDIFCPLSFLLSDPSSRDYRANDDLLIVRREKLVPEPFRTHMKGASVLFITMVAVYFPLVA
jgi:hypothetical protein